MSGARELLEKKVNRISYKMDVPVSTVVDSTLFAVPKSRIHLWGLIISLKDWSRLNRNSTPPDGFRTRSRCTYSVQPFRSRALTARAAEVSPFCGELTPWEAGLRECRQGRQ